jgi:molecular chaperone HscB
VKCGFPQPLGQASDFFEILGVPRRFGISSPGLSRRYFELSRELHPDRFSEADGDQRKNSIDRMSLINEAYRVLKNREFVRHYLLELEGVSTPPTPVNALAGEWFEVQEALDDAVPGARELYLNFNERLEAVLQKSKIELLERESDYDETGSRATLEDIAMRLKEIVTLESLLRDVRRRLR